MTDFITDIQNRCYLDAALRNLIEEANCKACPVTLMMFDIDNFSGVNELFGQKAGDRLLQSLAARVKSLIRKTDTFRWLGCDEFMILMPAGIDIAARVAERVRGRTQGDAFRVGAEKQPLSVTISIGLAESQGDAADLLRRAETALHRSKRSGRNRVFIDAMGAAPMRETEVDVKSGDFPSPASAPVYASKLKMAAIMAADVAFHPQLVAADEERSRLLFAPLQVFDDFVRRYEGRVFNSAGNLVMSEFDSAVESVRAAIDIQEALRTRNLGYPPDRRLQFRIGITIANVVERFDELLGEDINLAALLENLAEPGGICISRAVHEAVINKVSVRFRDLGEKKVNNILAPVNAFVVDWLDDAKPLTA
jgi:diguanylate cyclase (GGDEF)-like protein